MITAVRPTAEVLMLDFFQGLRHKEMGSIPGRRPNHDKVTGSPDSTVAYPAGTFTFKKKDGCKWPMDNPIHTQRQLPFWKSKSLAQMTPQEWESLCDRCGRCCMEKYEEEGTGNIYYTNVACYFYDIENGRCLVYEHRTELVSDCITLTPDMQNHFYWLPRTCAYRRLAEARGLAWWHPLISGTYETVYEAGISVKGKTISEQYVHPDDLEKFIVEWD